MIHFNIRNLQKKFGKLHYDIPNLNYQPDIIALTETKLLENKLYWNINIDGFKFIHIDSPTLAGGVGLYIQNSFSFTVSQNNHRLAFR